MTRDEEDALIRAAKAYDHDHRPRGRNWSQVPDHQVRRLLIGAGLIHPPPPPAELWEQAGRDPAAYRRLLREHGHLIAPGEPGYDEGHRGLDCGWQPGRENNP